MLSFDGCTSPAFQFHRRNEWTGVQLERSKWRERERERERESQLGPDRAIGKQCEGEKQSRIGNRKNCNGLWVGKGGKVGPYTECHLCILLAWGMWVEREREERVAPGRLVKERKEKGKRRRDSAKPSKPRGERKRKRERCSRLKVLSKYLLMRDVAFAATGSSLH